ncbi:MAG: SPOR domain-containing protein [Bacteroidales bacterium]|nr:SPOR domain-containing protein [Bacteroidales bacterium]MDD2322607.1 SPOR domain-containing protein [Bacteroidales bacterium]MDD3010020.1 SPOR domain-containing protein [Bacteroidales bacterium]MDD3960953.1 SPOR domain-containing protein [Bacteroidales bacterium]MDY0285726.1 SPOR domain-containing protein [Bacteroidales bacterium]
MNIPIYIKDLLYSHDCVIIPNLGGLLLNYKSATIHPVTNSFEPPAKTIAFNSNLKINDGLLANYISRKAKLNYGEALQEINEWVRQTREKLDQKQRITLESIGSFSLDGEGNLQFSPDEAVNYYSNSFGLGTFTSPSILRKQTIQPAPEKAKALNLPSRAGQFRRIAAVLIPAALLAGAVFLSFYTADNLDDKISYSGILVSCNRNPAVTPEESSTVFTAADTTNTEEAEEPGLVPPPPPTNQPPVLHHATPSRDFISRFKAPETPEKRNYIIVGSYNSLEAAEKKVEQLRAQYYSDAYIVNISSKNTYRVSAVSYFGFDKAKMQLQLIKEQLNTEAWILQM